MRAIDKLERLTVVAGTLKQELLKRLYVVFGSECVNIHHRFRMFVFLWHMYIVTKNTGLFISPSGTSELDCATTKKGRAERSTSIGRESLSDFFFVLGALAYLQVPPLGGSRDEKWRAQ